MRLVVKFREELQKLSAQPDVDVPIRIPKELLTGNVAADLGKKNAQKFVNSFIPTFVQGLQAAAKQAAASFGDKFSVEDVTKGINQTIRSGTGKLNVLAGAELSIEIEGGPASRESCWRTSPSRRRKHSRRSIASAPC